ncbi:MAG: hypothetical protein KDA51_20545 [Planctomycetales bacterium]|nr:hypothetical protein [Planctomycetales bacterium]MCB0344074.1 hypothetical protein [Bdellovibrionales bacterium]
MSSPELLLRQILAAPHPPSHPRLAEFVAHGAFAAQVVLRTAGQPSHETYRFALSAILAQIGTPAYGLLCDALLAEKAEIASVCATALGLSGLQTAPIVTHYRGLTMHEFGIVTMWGLGSMMNAAANDPSFAHMVMETMRRFGVADLASAITRGMSVETFHHEVGRRYDRRALAGKQFQLNRQFAFYAEAALWIWDNRSRFACGMTTPHGAIGDHGLPQQIQVLHQTDTRRAELVQHWLYRPEVLGDKEYKRLERECSGKSHAEYMRVFWALGALWALRQLSKDVVREAKDLR